MRINLPRRVKQIIERITDAGYEAYAVGGCIRDSILGRKPDDWDITTSALPEQIKEIFGRTVDTGIQHGTVTVLWEGEGFEVTTYRIDGKYRDARHPEKVTFTPSLEEDLKRRDFTVNAMAYNDRKGLVDLFGGVRDMEEGLIRCVGCPRERFEEDALRIMRAVRFSAQLGYRIEESTLRAAGEQAGTLRMISAERIQAELTKLLMSPHPEALRTVYETGIAAVVVPEFQRIMETPQNHPHHCFNVGEHTIRALQETEPLKELRLAVFFHDMGKPLCMSTDGEGLNHFYGHAQKSEEIAVSIMHRLRYDNKTLATVRRLVRFHDYGARILPDPVLVRRAVNLIGEDIFPLFLRVRRADIMAQSETFRQEKLKRLELWQNMYEEILEKGECVSLKTLAVTGEDLIGLGMKPGKELGEMLHRLLEAVLERPELNTREALCAYVKENFPGQK